MSGNKSSSSDSNLVDNIPKPSVDENKKRDRDEDSVASVASVTHPNNHRNKIKKTAAEMHAISLENRNKMLSFFVAKAYDKVEQAAARGITTATYTIEKTDEERIGAQGFDIPGWVLVCISEAFEAKSYRCSVVNKSLHISWHHGSQ